VAALYVLAPEDAMPRHSESARRDRLSTVEGALAIVGFAKLGALLGGAHAAAYLERAGAVADVVPVYVLRFARDLERIDAVVERIFDWHGPANRG
jgi:hypothetical protein